LVTVDESFCDRQICIVGLGYVGLTLAATMASVGFRAMGIEIRSSVLEMLRCGQSHFHEPGLNDMLAQGMADGLLEWHPEIPKDCEASVYIITVGTPLGEDGRVRLDMIERVTREIARSARPGSLVILRSTVMIGTTRNLVLPILEETGAALQVAFCPERTIEGQALRELRELPQIVGASDLQTIMRATQIFQFLTSTIVRVGSFETAEMIKLIDNVQRDVLFALANEVSLMCDAIGISADEVVRSGKLGYVRHVVPSPGPVGGPCLSKDSYILAQGVAPAGVVPEIALTSRKLNEQQLGGVAETLRGWTDGLTGFPIKPVITLLGLAFKGRPATDDIRGTTAKPILDALRDAYPTAEFRGFDAVVPAHDIAGFGIAPVDSLEDGFRGANLVLILNNHPVFENLPLSHLARLMRAPGIIYDLWHHYKAQELRLPPDIGYAAMGSHSTGRLPRGANY
jgi:nucleotide sugar dehydrogenase